jgi:virginiamycin B lyase
LGGINVKKAILLVGVICVLIVAVVAASGRLKNDKQRTAAGAVGAGVGSPDVGIGGVVTDANGKPVRGAVITVTSGNRTMSRFSDEAGRYKLSGVKAGEYTITATGFGLEEKQDTKNLSGNVDMNFSLAEKWDPKRLSTADWLTFLPQNHDVTELTSTCMGCHNYSNFVRNLGASSAEFQAKVAVMGEGICCGDYFRAEALERVPVLEKYFGPNASLPTREQVHHVEISDGALNSTIKEYTPPTPSYVHSITVDPVKQQVWFAGINDSANSIGRLDIATEKITEYKLPTPDSQPHTLVVAPDGRVWVTLTMKQMVVMLDPATGKITEIPGVSGHTPDVDYNGVIWFSGGVTGASKYDPRTGKAERFILPVPEGVNAFSASAGEDKNKTSKKGTSCSTYDVAVDQKGDAWFTTNKCGYIAKVDGKTGKVTTYKVPNEGAMKGLAASPEGIWYSAYGAHKLGRLNPETGEVKLYTAPSPYSSPYGVYVDRYSGNVWYADFFGSRITRLDPKTEKFTEFTLPTSAEQARFMGQDAQGRIWYADWKGGKVGMLDPGDQPAQLQATVRKPATR